MSIFGSGLRPEILETDCEFEVDCKWGFWKWTTSGDFGTRLQVGIL